ncbi:MAG: hypothetical protein IT285_10525 [Bdellovibrionales bacterium]|nr:hypothetical protein [Bdellovibrionales bacterium]
MLPWLATAAAFAFLSSVGPPDRGLRPPDRLESFVDRLWGYGALIEVGEAQARIAEFEGWMQAELDRLPGAPTLDLPEETETRLHGRYGVLPEVYVDKSYGATFPRPIARPVRVSWSETWQRARVLQRRLDRLIAGAENWSRLPDARRLARAGELESEWVALSAAITDQAASVRYLGAWVPRLRRSRNDSDVSRAFALARDPSLPAAKRAALWEALREGLRPKRVMRRKFLPQVLKPGTYVIPVRTDVSDRRFLAETEGALEMHWNQSPWARSRGVSFRIRWIRVPANQGFREGRRTLDAHIASFKADAVAMTTGADAHFTRNHVLVLAPGRITPRTIAHEFGHLLGFEDCYFRTLGARGFLGTEILEWSNPVYPDDLMCDDSEGVARAPIW